MNRFVAGMIKASGRSWWQARYSDGRVLSEWDTLATFGAFLPIGSSKTSRWEEAPKQGMIGLRLLCPNGMAGELEASEGHRFLQLKAGGSGVGIGASAGGHWINAHIIGVVQDPTGNCLCRAWIYDPGELITFEDNIHSMKFLNIGSLSLDVQQLKV